MSKRQIWLCAAAGLLLTALPVLLLELSSQPGGGDQLVEEALTLLTGPGVLISRRLFGIHNLGFFVVAPLLNFLFWSAACCAISSACVRLYHHSP